MDVLQRDLHRRTAGIVIAEDAEARRLSLDAALEVFVAILRRIERAGKLGANEEPIGAVAEPGYANRRENLYRSDRHDQQSAMVVAPVSRETGLQHIGFPGIVPDDAEWVQRRGVADTRAGAEDGDRDAGV